MFSQAGRPVCVLMNEQQLGAVLSLLGFDPDLTVGDTGFPSVGASRSQWSRWGLRRGSADLRSVPGGEEEIQVMDVIKERLILLNEILKRE